VLPIVAVQIAPGPAEPVLEDQLLRACSAGLERARCVSARFSGAQPSRGVAVVSWDNAEHVSIEVGLARDDEPVWASRELEFIASDPETERWRAVGFTIALLADDPRFWPEPDPAPPEDSTPREASKALDDADRWLAELCAIAGSGVVSGPLRWGAELRLSVPISEAFFATASADYSLARSASLDVRWFGGSVGAGLHLPALFADIDARFRVELLSENVAVAVRREALSERQSAWVPGVSIGSDLLWPIARVWVLSARVDAFWLDGATSIVSAGQRIGTVAGAGLVLGLGTGYRF
jgi:hypothetical protein